MSSHRCDKRKEFRWLTAPARCRAWPAGSHGEHDLADVRARSMRAWASAALASGKVESITGLIEPAATSGQTLVLNAAGDRRLFRDRAGTQRRAGVDEALAHQVAEVGGRLGAAGERHLGDGALFGRAIVVAVDVVAADDVDDQIGALAAGGLLGIATKSSVL